MCFKRLTDVLHNSGHACVCYICQKVEGWMRYVEALQRSGRSQQALDAVAQVKSARACSCVLETREEHRAILLMARYQRIKALLSTQKTY